MNNEKYKVLVVGPSWVGDMVMAHSLFRAINDVHGDVEIDVLAPAWTRQLTNRMPEIRDSIDMPLGHGELGLLKRYRLGKSLRDKKYDQAIVLPGSFKSALVPFWAKIPKRTGFISEARYWLLNDARKLDKQLLEMTVQRFVSLAFPKSNEIPDIRVPQLVGKPENGKKILSEKGAYSGKKTMTLCPGAEYGPAKRWPPEYYAEIAKEIINKGWEVIILGSEKDKEITASVNSLSGEQCIDMAGKTSLEDVIDIISLSDLVISNDSGLMHVAAALDKRLIAIYGSSDPHFTPPLSSKSKIVSLNLSCSPCMARDCKYEHYNCLSNLKPELVLEEISKIGVD